MKIRDTGSNRAQWSSMISYCDPVSPQSHLCGMRKRLKSGYIRDTCALMYKLGGSSNLSNTNILFRSYVLPASILSMALFGALATHGLYFVSDEY